MAFDDTWRALREACEGLPADALLVTPRSKRLLAVEAVEDDRVAVRYADETDPRPLRRDRFAVLYHRLDELSGGVPLSGLQPGSEPYVAVLSLHPDYEVDEAAGLLRRVEGGTAGGRSVVEPGEEAAAPAEEEASMAADLRDDAVLLADLLDRSDVSEPDALGTGALVDLYVLLSDVHRGADGLRRRVGERLLDRVSADEPVYSQFGAVQRTTRERRHLRDDETVLSALDDEGIPHEWVLGVVPEKVDVVLSVTDLAESAVYDATEQVYVRKAEVREEAKASRLAGLRDRLADLDDEQAERLRAEVADLERRIEDLLASR